MVRAVGVLRAGSSWVHREQLADGNGGLSGDVRGRRGWVEARRRAPVNAANFDCYWPLFSTGVSGQFNRDALLMVL